jgi:hypothetical protein
MRAARLALAVALVSGCGSVAARTQSVRIPRSLALEARPIGRGARFHPPASGPVIGPCTRSLGPRFAVHVEVFAANRVVLIAAGIGVRRPWRASAGRIAAARCFGALVTLEPTGVLLITPGDVLSLGGLFHSWGQPLSNRRLAGFKARPGHAVVAFVDGRRWPRSPGQIPLVRHSEIVLEVGPFVPPHRSYVFPPGT